MPAISLPICPFAGPDLRDNRRVCNCEKVRENVVDANQCQACPERRTKARRIDPCSRRGKTPLRRL